MEVWSVLGEGVMGNRWSGRGPSGKAGPTKAKAQRQSADLKFGHYTDPRHWDCADIGRSMLRPYEERTGLTFDH